MKSQNINKTKASGEGSHSRVLLNRLHVDFRNAKPAFFSVSYGKSDDIRTKPDVQQSELSCSQNSRKVDVLNCSVDAGGAGAAEICKTARRMTGSAVQVDDGDSERVVDVSAAAAVRLHSCSVAMKSEPTDRSRTFTPFTTEYTHSTAMSLPECGLPEKKILPPSAAPSSLLVPSLLSKQTDFCDHKEQKPRCTNNSITESKADVRVADSVVRKQSSVPVKVKPHDENVKHALHTTSCNTVESSGCGINSGTSPPSSTLPFVAYNDAFDDVSLSDWKSPVRSATISRAKRSLKSKNLDTMTSASCVDEAKCKDSKLKVVRTMKRRQKIKSESEDEVWSTHKKLLIMPINKKSPNSGRSRKRNTGIKRDIFGPMPKCKRRKSFSVTGIELPDLSTTLDSSVDDADVPNVSCKLESGVDDNTSSASTSRKWCIDITGADLTMDSDVDHEQKFADISDPQKHLVPDKAAKQNVSQLTTQYATDAECRCPDFSGSQVTPPPSVASDGFSSCDESNQPLRSNAQEETNQKPSSIDWFTIDTKVARYIEGRHFDRLVNGISVQIPATLTQETVAQFGQECLRLEKLTKRDLKELQNQVRLEEIYHRRAKKMVIFPFSSANKIEIVNPDAFQQHNVSNIAWRSAARLATEVHLSDDDEDTESEAGEADAASEQGASFAVGGQCQLSEESDNDTVSYLSSDDNETVEPDNCISEPDGIYTSELLEGDVTEASKAADGSCINTDGSAQLESPTIRVLIRRQVHADKNQSQMQDQLGEPAPVGVGVLEQMSAPSNCSNSETPAVSDSPVPGNSLKAVSRPAKKNVSLLKRAVFHPAANKPAAAVSMRHAVIDAVTARTDMSDRDTVQTGESEYIAAIALASLSVSNRSTETTFNHSHTNEEHKMTVTVTDSAAVSKPAHDSSSHYLTKPSSASKNVNKSSSVGLSKHAVARNERHNLKESERRGLHVSADKPTSRSCGDSVCEVSASEGQGSRGWRSHSAKAFSDDKRVTRSKEKLSVSTVNNNSGLNHVVIHNVNNNDTEANIEGQRSRDRRSHSAKVDDDQKRVMPSKENLSVTYLSKSTINSDNGSSHLAAGSMSKNITEVAGIASDNSENNSCTGSDRMSHRKRTSGSRHSIEKEVFDRREKKQVAENSLANCAAGNMNKSNREVAGVASDNFSENNSCVTSDKTSRRRHTSRSRHSVEKDVFDHHEKKRVAVSNLAKCDARTSSQTKVESDHRGNCGIDTSLVRSGVPARGENAQPFDSTIVTSSVDTSMPCTFLSNHSSVLSQSLSSPSLASQGLVGSKDTVECSRKETGNREKKISKDTLSLSSTDQAIEVQAGLADLVKGTVRNQALSDLNSNDLSKSSQILSVVTKKQCGDTNVAQVVSGNADTGLVKSAIFDAVLLPGSSLLTGNDMTLQVKGAVQSSLISADFSAESPISPYRESEDIRSPSPMSSNVQEDDRAEEIRSPSPCELESPATLFRVIETSWDVRLPSPCEIQSPDASDDEAGDNVKEFSQRCNVCYHQGPVTIPLTTKEAGKGTHNQQLDMT